MIPKVLRFVKSRVLQFPGFSMVRFARSLRSNMEVFRVLNVSIGD